MFQPDAGFIQQQQQHSDFLEMLKENGKDFLPICCLSCCVQFLSSEEADISLQLKST